jgi:hypothetical protein
MTIEQGNLRLLESDPRQAAAHVDDPGPLCVHGAGRHRVRALRANPDIAVTVDTETFPPEVLSIRGRTGITEVDGVVPEYARSAHRYLGSEQATAYLAQIDHPSTRMARIAVRPTWVGLLDFQTRMPSALGGT